MLGLGIAGCRVSVERPLYAGQEFKLTIEVSGEEIVTNVVVIYWRLGGFAGLHFTSMSEEARKRLERLVEHISKTFAEPESSPSA